MNDIKLFKEIEQHLLKDEKPSLFLNKIKDNGLLNHKPFRKLKKLEEMQQSPKHHPEGNVWIHTMMVVDEGAKYREKVNDRRAFMWCLLLHDIGKIKTTKLRKGRWTSYNHDKVGEEDGMLFLNNFIQDKEFKNKVCKMIRYHMHLLYIMNKLPFADMQGLKKNVDINDISYVFLSDRFGRENLTNEDKIKIKKEVDKFREMKLD